MTVDLATRLDVTSEELMAASQLLGLPAPGLLFQGLKAPDDRELDGLAASGRRFLAVRELLRHGKSGDELDENLARTAELLAAPALLACVAEAGPATSLSWLCADDTDAVVLSALGDSTWRLRFVPPADLLGAVAVLAAVDLGWPDAPLGAGRVEIALDKAVDTAVADDPVAHAASAVRLLSPEVQREVAAIVGDDARFHTVAVVSRHESGTVSRSSTSWVVHDRRGGHRVELSGDRVTLWPATPDDVMTSIQEGFRP